MLRKEIVSSVNNVLHAIETSGVFLIMRSCVMKRDKGISKEEILSSYQHYMHETKSFGNAENEIIKIFDINHLQEPAFWTILLSSDDKPHQIVQEVFQKLRFMSEHLPKVLLLLKRGADEIKEQGNREDGKRSETILTAILIEEHEISSAKRIVVALESIEGLYDAASQILGVEGQDLSVVSCDSGSDKTFDLLGAAKVITCIKDIILSFWDKTIYFQENKTNKQLEVIANSLPIITELESMKESGSIEPERAELLKRQIIGSIEKFSDAGIVIPEINSRTVFNPRQLMRPQRKLLVSPPKELPQSQDTLEDIDSAEISDPEFDKYMEKMAKKFLQKRSTNN